MSKRPQSPARHERGTPEVLTQAILGRGLPKSTVRRRIVFEVDTVCTKQQFNVRAVNMAREFIDSGETAVLLTTEDIE